MYLNESNNENQLILMYRKLRAEAEKLTQQNPERANSLRSEASRLMNQVQLIRRRGRSMGRGGFHYA